MLNRHLLIPGMDGSEPTHREPYFSIVHPSQPNITVGMARDIVEEMAAGVRGNNRLLIKPQDFDSIHGAAAAHFLRGTQLMGYSSMCFDLLVEEYNKMRDARNDFRDRLLAEEERSKQLQVETLSLNEELSQAKAKVAQLEDSEGVLRLEKEELDRGLAQAKEALSLAQSEAEKGRTAIANLTALQPRLELLNDEAEKGKVAAFETEELKLQLSTAQQELEDQKVMYARLVDYTNQRVGLSMRSVICSIRHLYKEFYGANRTWPSKRIYKAILRGLYRFDKGVPDPDSEDEEEASRLLAEVKKEEVGYIASERKKRGLHLLNKPTSALTTPPSKTPVNPSSDLESVSPSSDSESVSPSSDPEA